MKSISLNNRNVKCMIKIGEAYLLLDDEHSISEAITYLNQAVKFEPLNYNGLIGLSKAYEKKGLMEQAVDYCFRALERPESHVNTKFYLVHFRVNIREIFI